MTTRTFALVMGIVYTAVGIFGFLPGLVAAPPAGTPDVTVTSGYGYLLGLFPINILHNFVHLGLGIWGLMAYRTWPSAVSYSRGLAIIYGVLTIMGLIPVLNTTFGLIPIFGHDIWLHAITAIAAAYFGYGARAEAVPAERMARRAS